MSEQRVRTAVVGAVRHAIPYLTVLSRDPRIELVTVADEPGAASWILADGAAVAARFGLPFSTALSEELDTDRVDLVLVCAEPSRHARLTGLAVSADIAVCVDKPVAVSVADADAWIRSVGQRPVFVVNRLHGRQIRRLRQWMDDGGLGVPLHLDVEFIAAASDLERSVERIELLLDPALSGGGELRNFLGYAVDTVRFLTGLDVMEVYAESATLFDGPHAAFGQEDTGIVSMTLERGVTATALISRTAVAPGGTPASSTVRVIGSHGHAEIDESGPRLIHAMDTSARRVAIDDGGISSFFSDLVDRLGDGRPPEYGLADAVAAVRVVDAAVRSAASGAPQAVSAG